MMRVIIVHDRDNVASDISEICASCGVSPDRIVRVKDTSSARREMSRALYDLAVIDLTLPHIFGRDTPSYATADQLLSELYLLDDLNAPGDVIGITQEPSALERVSNSIASNVMTIIKEDAEGSWKKQLCEKIGYTRKASNQRQTATNAQYDFDALIFTALDVELAPFREKYDFTESKLFNRAYTFAFADANDIPRRGVAYAVGKSGQSRAASTTQSLLSIFRPRIAIMTGICGGVPGKTELGDIIFAEAALDWDYGKWEDDGHPVELGCETERPKPTSAHFVSRPDPESISDSSMHGLVRDLINSRQLGAPEEERQLAERTQGLIKKYCAHFAPYGSGSAVVGSEIILKQVRSLNDAIKGVDMESFGFYHAAKHTHVAKPEVICVKSVSDFSDGTKNDKYHEACCYASARVGMMIIEQLWKFDS